MGFFDRKKEKKCQEPRKTAGTPTNKPRNDQAPPENKKSGDWLDELIELDMMFDD